MITVYRKQGNAIHAETLTPGQPIPGDSVWIDMYTPSHEEEIAAENQLGIQIPSREEVWKNQVLNRLYQEGDVTYMTAAIINKVDTPYPQTSAVTFILTPSYLLTMRYISPTSFQYFASRIQRSSQKFRSGARVLEGLLEEVINRVAHNSEIAVEALDQMSHNIFSNTAFSNGNAKSNTTQTMMELLKKLGSAADLNSKINESLHSLSRMLSFFKQTHGSEEGLEAEIVLLMADAKALSQQTAFLSDKITFQLDAMLGMINVEQNMIIKIFSIVTVFFLPPTLVSSIYGMNFQIMPELHWLYGYPWAIGLMVLVSMVPYFYFKKKGWL